MIAIEFHEPPQWKGKLAWRLMHKIDESLFPQLVIVPMLSKHRVLTQVAGHHMDVIKILPPLTIGEAEVDRFVNALDETLTECTSLSGPIMELAINTAKVQFGGGPVAQRPGAGKNGRNGHSRTNDCALVNGPTVHDERERQKRSWPRQRQKRARRCCFSERPRERRNLRERPFASRSSIEKRLGQAPTANGKNGRTPSAAA